ncbi:MAG: MBL fold metallo-hydrolase [Anaerolineaceae bacterium]|nr:MBL fold metallo-hydrolase [Anaerolineaceae bacterium]
MALEIIWYGHSCFRFTERGMASVVTDPFDSDKIGYTPIKLKADIVTSSCNLPGHRNLSAIKGSPFEIVGPGEYEIGEVFITGVQTNGKKKNTDEITNTLYLIDYNGLTIAHLGNMNHIPSQTEIETLGNVNVALVPVGGGSGLNASKASEIISLLEPDLVVPMHYKTPGCKIELDPLNKFLKEMGLNDVVPEASLKIDSSRALPEDTKVIVLTPKI